VIDQARHFSVAAGTPGNPSSTYLTAVPAGDHVVSLLAPLNCSVKTAPQQVTVTGGPIREAVEAAFSVACGPPTPNPGFGIVRFTAPVIAHLANPRQYHVWDEHFGYWDYAGNWTDLGALDSSGTLVAQLPGSNTETGGDPYWYEFYLMDASGTCGLWAPSPSPLPGYSITSRDTLEVEFTVACKP
jgi:hypothetical protein